MISYKFNDPTYIAISWKVLDSKKKNMLERVDI